MVATCIAESTPVRRHRRKKIDRPVVGPALSAGSGAIIRVLALLAGTVPAPQRD